MNIKSIRLVYEYAGEIAERLGGGVRYEKRGNHPKIVFEYKDTTYKLPVTTHPKRGEQNQMDWVRQRFTQHAKRIDQRELEIAE
jgi:hypothetical protein